MEFKLSQWKNDGFLVRVETVLPGPLEDEPGMLPALVPEVVDDSPFQSMFGVSYPDVTCECGNPIEIGVPRSVGQCWQCMTGQPYVRPTGIFAKPPRFCRCGTTVLPGVPGNANGMCYYCWKDGRHTADQTGGRVGNLG